MMKCGEIAKCKSAKLMQEVFVRINWPLWSFNCRNLFINPKQKLQSINQNYNNEKIFSFFESVKNFSHFFSRSQSAQDWDVIYSLKEFSISHETLTHFFWDFFSLEFFLTCFQRNSKNSLSFKNAFTPTNRLRSSSHAKQAITQSIPRWSCEWSSASHVINENIFFSFTKCVRDSGSSDLNIETVFFLFLLAMQHFCISYNRK